MSRFVVSVACAIAGLVVVAGCGSGSGAPAVDISTYAGSYSATYNRQAASVMHSASANSVGNMIIAVASNGQITITLVDSVDGTFVGTGIANHVGGFYITCNGASGKQVTVNGTLKGTGLGRTSSGTIAGSIVVAYSANFLGAPDVTAYTNHYVGTFQQGSTTGDWLGDVTAGGAFAGTLIIPTGNVTLTGTVYSNGSYKFTSSGGATTFLAVGNFALSQSSGVTVAGLLTGTTGNTKVVGNFSGHNDIGG